MIVLKQLKGNNTHLNIFYVWSLKVLAKVSFVFWQVLPVMVFFSCVTTILYHLGIMQAIISKMAFVMHFTLGTTAAESLCAAANIFVGLVKIPFSPRNNI